MQKYFISEENLKNGVITGDDAYQLINVLRAKPGYECLVSDGNKTYLVRCSSFTKDEVAFEISEEKIGNVELPVFVSIFQGYPKGDKMEDIIKHGTELGASAFYPVIMKRSVVRIEDKKVSSKLARFQKIAKEAAEQSLRNRVPEVPSIPRLKEIDFSSYDVKILCYEESAKKGEYKALKTILSALKPGMRVAALIGPEGGIDDDELEYLKTKGFVPCALGPRILRTETAPYYILSAISYETELDKE